MMPSQSAMMPINGSEMSITATLAMLKAPSATSFIWLFQPPMRTAHKTSPSQM